MSTSTGSPAVVDAVTRGTLVIANRVVEKIAAEAALDVESVGGLTSRRLPGGRVRAAGNGSRPRASARIGRGSTRISMSLSIRYPARIVDICDDVRAQVIRQVADLAGLRVTHIDIDVSAFEIGSGPDIRVQ
ncbi:Asp23/Gls24 family envelope stress response protein [Frankia sp. Cppng1_Ct_nod]|uniref:Asp23/Gls24 family envelope stress response protein n=1 Tax=Frankia sp. Cppng1_Ct_nod TaxID=2897162 RepID=UPI00104156D5|nr:Asp23/Gls24 family envelope stress response protein [Frankia sp. Cppng1_Ct_nod]